MAYLPNSKSGLLISINVLEMHCVIVNFAATIYACWHNEVDLSAFPVLLNWCDNTAACSWVSKTNLREFDWLRSWLFFSVACLCHTVERYCG